MNYAKAHIATKMLVVTLLLTSCTAANDAADAVGAGSGEDRCEWHRFGQISRREFCADYRLHH